MKKRILLTGGSGFIGRNLLDKLGDKYDFTAPSHAKLNLRDFDSVKKFFQKQGHFDYVLHTAITGGNRMTGDLEELAFQSMRMFYNLANQERYFTKFFYFGSGIEYGKEKPIKKFKEDRFGKRVPQSNWGLFKYSCAKYTETHPKFVNLRIFGAFGKWEDYRIRFISNSICKYILNLPIVINRNSKMDYLYIDDLVDVVDGFIAAKKLKFNSYNLTPTQNTDLVTITKKINLLSTRKVAVVINQKGFSPEYTGDNKRLLSQLPSLKFTKIGEAILDLYNWYKSKPGIISKKELTKNYF